MKQGIMELFLLVLCVLNRLCYYKFHLLSTAIILVCLEVKEKNSEYYFLYPNVGLVLSFHEYIS